MNKVYKLIWSKTRNMYVAVCEFAKSHTKSPKRGAFSRTLAVGLLAYVLSCGVTMPAHAVNMSASDFYNNYYYATTGWAGGTDGNGNSVDYILGINKTNGTIGVFYTGYGSGAHSGQFTSLGNASVNLGGSGSGSDPNAIYSLLANGNTITYTKGDGSTGSITTALQNLTGTPTTQRLGTFAHGYDVMEIETVDGYLTGIKFGFIENESTESYTPMYKIGATGVGGTTYTAGNGISISSDNKIYV